jgi:hypothetical protein
MKDYNNLPFHPTMERLVEILRKKTQNEDPMFFRLVVSYFFCKLASMMRTNVQITPDQLIPINMYGINLAPSGSGKGHSINILEEQVMSGFRHQYLEHTFPEIAERNLAKLALARAKKLQTDPDEETTRAQMEFEECGPLLFSFDSGTSAAVKQMRMKLLMAKAGSMNLEIDEIGSNLLGNGEVLNTYLELFDTGRIKQKLIKNTRDNVRQEDLFGSTPTNMLLFGTPTKLLNGSKTEDEFYDFLEVGYARRCFFGFSRKRKTKKNQTAQDIYNIYNDQASNNFLSQLCDQIGLLADHSQFGQTIRMTKDVTLALFEYRIRCQTLADEMSEYDEIRKAELSHRYFKVAKLAAAYAFVDKSINVKMDHLENAIAMAEISGDAFEAMMNRDRPYIKLANYLAACGRELTHADLVEDLPFYKGTEAQKRDMINLAIAHGYKNNIFIRRDMMDGIEFLSGKSVPETDLSKVILSASKDMASGYATHRPAFDKLHCLLCKDGYHWVNHSLKDAYRDESHVIPGFNLVVLDVEKSVSLDIAKKLLEEYKYFMHTTRRHTEAEHRFRIVIPLSHTLELNAQDYRDFMNNLFDWLPFEVDRATAQRARKWLTNNGKSWYNDGQLLDALQFVPKTKKADERKNILAGQTNLTNLERWFVNNTGGGSRNNQLIKYAYACMDMGQDLHSIQSNVLELNRKLSDPLEETEVLSTVISSISRKFHTKGVSK